jgi:LysR family glycine cleavage system transcriptional activator
LIIGAISLILAALTKGVYSLKMKISHPSAPELTPVRALPPVSALLAFERAAAQLSFRRAARDLALSPSAISHQIRGLEERFGVRLFARTGRSVRLTTEGERYLQAVSAGLALLEDGSRELLRQGHRVQTELHISSLPFFTNTILIPRLDEFTRRCPGVTLRFEATHRYADFEKSQVDAAIRFGRERSVGLKFEPLIKVSSLPVCAPKLVQKGLLKPRDLDRMTLIHVSVQPRAWAVWLADAGEPNLTPRNDLWFDTVPAALEAAEHGLGVALAMHPLIKAHKGFGRVLVIPFNAVSNHTEILYLVTRPERTRQKTIDLFRRWLMETVARVVDT